MAISWITALKVIPWGDVVEAAPHIVRGARRLLNSGRGRASPAAAPRADIDPDDPVARLYALEAQVDDMREEQVQTAELVRTLAEQNERIVAALELLRVRTRVLIWACAGLALGLGGTVVWIVAR